MRYSEIIESKALVASKVFVLSTREPNENFINEHIGFITTDGYFVEMSGHRNTGEGDTYKIAKPIKYKASDLKKQYEVKNYEDFKLPVEIKLSMEIPHNDHINEPAENCGSYVVSMIRANGHDFVPSSYKIDHIYSSLKQFFNKKRGA